MLCGGKILLLLAVVEIIITAASNAKHSASKIRKNYRSTSSESGRAASDSDSTSGDEESLELSGSGLSSEPRQAKLGGVKNGNTFNVQGWRKWHRKCVPCPEEMAMNYKNRQLQWICGGHQRARRTFKSACIMYFRNCQDGTLFVKIHNGFCNRSGAREGIGEHFFYDYSAASDSEPGSKDSDESD